MKKEKLPKNVSSPPRNEKVQRSPSSLSSSSSSDELPALQAPATINLSTWMADLPDRLKNQPLSLLGIPGTHNSLTSEIRRFSRVSPDSDAAKRFKWVPWFITSRLIYPWSRCQTRGVDDQLMQGIRYLDLRLCVRHMSKRKVDFYVVHGQYVCRFADTMKKIKTFLHSHPKEVVLLDVNHAYKFTNCEYVHDLTKIIKDNIGSLLYPYDKQIPSINAMLQQQKQILFLSCLDHSDYLFWPEERIKSPWPNTISVQVMMDFLKQRYGKRNNPNQFYVIQGILTADSHYIFRHLFGGLRDLALPASQSFVKWIPNLMAGISGVNITIIDFAVSEFPDYSRLIVKLNYS